VLSFDVIGTLQTIALLQLHYAPFEYSIVQYFHFMLECNTQNEGHHFTARKILENFFFLNVSDVDRFCWYVL